MAGIVCHEIKLTARRFPVVRRGVPLSEHGGGVWFIELLIASGLFCFVVVEFGNNELLTICVDGYGRPFGSGTALFVRFDDSLLRGLPPRFDSFTVQKLEFGSCQVLIS
jgi:hypothetical protein